jgi:C-terminal processing protease CtpA/Prc
MRYYDARGGGRIKVWNKLRPLWLIALFFMAWRAGAGSDDRSFSKVDRGMAQTMLKSTLGDIKNNYYDPKFHGVDIGARFAEAGAVIDRATTFREAVQAIEGAVGSLNDSHTHFLPPVQPYQIEYGYRMAMVGDTCYIIHVKPGSDASVQGVKSGDIVESVDGRSLTRENFFDVEYSLNVFAPRSATTLRLLSPAKVRTSARVATSVVQTRGEVNFTGMGVGLADVNKVVRERNDYIHHIRPRYADLGEKLEIVKLPIFHYSDEVVDEIAGHFKRHQALIIDLRGNPGGAVTTLGSLMGSVFDYKVKICEQVERSGNKPEMATFKGHGAFTGKLIVLIDSASYSASEVFARVIQLEKRGIVIGDVSLGKVMESKTTLHNIGSSSMSTNYGSLVTMANLLMADGKSLEGTGVTPDFVVLPGAQDLATGDDTVLAYAARQAGVEITPQAAGKLFPFEWPPQ